MRLIVWGLGVPCRRRMRGKWKVPARVLGLLHVLPAFSIRLSPGMIVVFPGLPGYVALSVHGGRCQIRELEYPEE